MARKTKLTGQYKEKYINNDHLYDKEFTLVGQEIKQGLLTSQYSKKENTIKCMEIMDICRKQMNLIYPQEKKSRE